MQGGAKTLFFANFADGATQEKILLWVLCHPVGWGASGRWLGLFSSVSQCLRGEIAVGLRRQKRF
jgi:hypothetical protein